MFLQLIAKVMCGVSTSLRFPGQLNGYVVIVLDMKYSLSLAISDLRKLSLNLIPFPRVCIHLLAAKLYLLLMQLHFLMPSYAPFTHPNSQAFQKTSVPELVSSCVTVVMSLLCHYQISSQIVRPKESTCSR